MKTPWLAFWILFGFLPRGISAETATAEFEFDEGTLKKFAGKVPIEVAVVEGRENHLVRISNISEDHITLREHPSSWTSDLRYGQEWKLDVEGGLRMADAETLPHKMLMPSLGGKSPYAVPRTVFKIMPKAEPWAGASAVRYHLGLGAYFPSIREYVHFDVIVTVPLDPDEVENAEGEAVAASVFKPWVVIDGEPGDFLEQHEGMDVLVIHTADWDLSGQVMMKHLQSPELAGLLNREELVIGLLDCRQPDSPGAAAIQRHGAAGFVPPSLAMHHRDGMVTFSKVDLISREAFANTLLAIIEKSEAGKIEPLPWVGRALINQEMFVKATAVVRARISGGGEGSKYTWTEVTKLKTLKAPDGVDLPEAFEVASYSFVDLPAGEATLYLTRYNPDRPELGWKLLQEKEAGKWSEGYSHHVRSTD